MKKWRHIVISLAFLSMILSACKKDEIHTYNSNGVISPNGTTYEWTFNRDDLPQIAGLRIEPSYALDHIDTIIYSYLDSTATFWVDSVGHPIDTTYEFFVNDSMSLVPYYNKVIDIRGWDHDGNYSVQVDPSQDNATGEIPLGSLNITYEYPFSEEQDFDFFVQAPQGDIQSTSLRDEILFQYLEIPGK
ncbi:MAG: hypothetical protein JXR30_01190 [Alphaproteobacteria bacterium]|nr:hypothetical protein [Alphaproteobacteria bacterium]